MTIVKKSVPGIIALIAGYGLLLATVGGIAVGAGDSAPDPAQAGLGLIAIPVVILIIYGYTLLAVSMHRIFLLGPDSIPGSGYVRFTSREWRFFGWGIALGLTAGLVGAITIGVLLSLLSLDPVALAEGYTPLLSLWTFVGLLPMAYLLGRLSFVLPGTATGSRPTFAWSWALSRRYQWQTMLVVGVTPLAINLVFEMLATLLPPLLVAMLSIVLGIYLAIFGIAILSFSYRTLCELQPELQPPPLDDAPTGGGDAG